jgi:hypothetical protein
MANAARVHVSRTESFKPWAHLRGDKKAWFLRMVRRECFPIFVTLIGEGLTADRMPLYGLGQNGRQLLTAQFLE